MTWLGKLLEMPMMQSIGWVLVHFVWQGAALALALASANAAIGRSNSKARYAAACITMLVMLVCPLVTIAVLYERQPVVVSHAWTDLAADASTVAPLATSHAATPFRRNLSAYLPWLVLGWLAGVIALSVRWAGGWIYAEWLKRTGTIPALEEWQTALARLSARLKVARPVRLYGSLATAVPTVIGWVRPVILMPASALSGLGIQQVEALLAHELAHIRRCDYLVNLLQKLVETLLFYHPAVWWIGRRIREEREHCCDDLAVEACGDVLVYTRALASMETLRGSAPALALAATGGGTLLGRIRRLLRQPEPRKPGAAPAAVFALALLCALIWAPGQKVSATQAPANRQPEPSREAQVKREAEAVEQQVRAVKEQRRAAERRLRESNAALQQSTPVLREAEMELQAQMEHLKSQLAEVQQQLRILEEQKKMLETQKAILEGNTSLREAMFKGMMYSYVAKADPEAEQRLVSLYDGLQDEILKRLVIESLAKTRGNVAVEKLFWIARLEPSQELRKHAIRGLADRTPAGTERLIQVYDGTTDLGIKRLVIECLARQGDIAARQKLEWIARDDDPELRSFVKRFLDRQ
jgi:beta-lactamase regulating signal transducer with metallopeptidase domain